MRLAPFALLALFALPACEPYGYGYAGTYGAPGYVDPGYGGPAYGGPVYGSPYYQQPGPAYVAPPAAGLLLFGGGRDDRRGYDRPDYRRGGDGRRDERVDRGRPQPQAARGAPPPRSAPPSAFVGPRGGGHAPDFNPANPGAQGGADR